MAKTALITGITGQDGSYLAELLLQKGYDVHGLIRRTSLDNCSRIKHILDQITVHTGDLSDSGSIETAIKTSKPDEVYNLGAQTHVKVSFDSPESTFDITGGGCLRVLENLRKNAPDAKFYQASTSELFGQVLEVPQTELTPFNPNSPYACAKLYAYYLVNNYREAYGTFACNGILFNHGSPRRGEDFIEQKLVRGICKWANGEIDELSVGNLNAKRDIGHAKDYVYAQWLMLQQDTPEDYVIATGEQYSIREIAEHVCQALNFNISWEGQGLEEVGIIDGKVAIDVSEKYFRPGEVNTLLGDPGKAKYELGWEPSYSFEELIGEMVEDVVRTNFSCYQ